MPTTQELQSQVDKLDPKARQNLIKAIQTELAKRGELPEGEGQQNLLSRLTETLPQKKGFISGFTGETQGGGILPRLGQGLRAVVKGLPAVMAGQVPKEEKREEPTFYEKELFKAQLKKKFEEPEKRKITRLGILKKSGELNVIETDVDKVLKEITDKSDEELTPMDLINLYKILATPAGGKPTGFLGLGGRAYTPEQQMLRQKAQEMLDRSGATEEELEAGAEEEGEADEFGFTIGEEKEARGKKYRYIGNNQWQEI